MPFDSGGTFNALPPPTFPAVSGTRIRADYFNATINDLISGLTEAYQSPQITGDLLSSAPGKGTDLVGGSSRVVNSIASLRLQLISGNGNVFVAGYYTNGDGGGGHYYYDAADTTSTDNGGTTIVAADNGRWKLIPEGNLSPLTFGCRGDGTTDDTANMTAFFAAVSVNGSIDLRNRTYMITSAIPRPATGVKVQNGKFYLNNPTSFQIYALVANDNCTFDNVSFLGTGAIGTTASVTFTASVGNATSGTLTSALANGNYIFSFSDGSVRYVTVTTSTSVTWTGALSNTSTLTATYPSTARYQGGIFGGNTQYAAPMNTAPASNVTITRCTFDNLTVGCWSGGSSTDAVPLGWRVIGNTFKNMVGVPSLSEGYGCLFTPSSDGVIAFNTFTNIRRHAVYGAAEWSNNVVYGNVIDGVDNIAIQSNTGVGQNYADGNIISNNVIRGFTRSVPYGYLSSVGVGLYGKVKNTLVSDNKIYGPLDTGLDTEGELSGAAYSDRIQVQGNLIVMDPTATDSGIRIGGLQSGKFSGNQIVLQGAINGFTITSAAGIPTTLIDISENSLDTSNAGAQAFRIALGSARTINVRRNTLNGFANVYTNKMNDTSTAGIVRTDLNNDVGFFGSDADFTHNAGGTISGTDCPRIRHAGVLTAARNVFLSDANVPDGSTVNITRTGTGSSVLNIKDGAGGLIKALAFNNWIQCGWNAAGGWEELASGTL